MTVAKGHQTGYLCFPWVLLKVRAVCPWPPSTYLQPSLSYFFLLLTFLQNESGWNYRCCPVSPKIRCESLPVISLILDASPPFNQQMITFYFSFFLFFKVFSIWNWQVEWSSSQRYIFLEKFQHNWTMSILQTRHSKPLGVSFFFFFKCLVIFSIKILSQNQLDLEMSVYWTSSLVWILAVQSVSAGFNNIAKRPVEKINL